MRTLTIHTADALAVRWKRLATGLEREAGSASFGSQRIRERATVYRLCAAELDALTAVSMEMEATHHGDPEYVPPATETVEQPGGPFIRYTQPATEWEADVAVDFETNLLEWSQGERP